jgi:hypothetical protein
VARLTRDEILEAWTRLGQRAHAEGQAIELIVVGGAVMAVHFRSRASTADVDGIFEPAADTRPGRRRSPRSSAWPRTG